MACVVAIDQGTTGSTVLVLDKRGRVVARAYSEFTQYYPKPGWVEHDAEEIWRVTLAVLRKAVKAAKLKGFRWHDLRHTWASWAVMSGVRLEELQRLGGWKTAQMVQRYAHLSPEHLADAAEKVAPVSLKRGTKRGTVGG